MTPIKLSATEQAALYHRLCAREAIAEAIEASGEYSYSHIEESIDYVTDCVLAGEINMAFLSCCDQVVLTDCMSGSTYAAALQDEISGAAYRRISSRLQALPAKLGLDYVSFAV